MPFELTDIESVVDLAGELGLLQEAIQKAMAAMIMVRFIFFNLD